MDEIKKLLIISSDKKIREVLEFCFDGWGYEVYIEPDLLNDIARIKKISPDVIIVDVKGVKKEQIEICHILKDDFTTNFIPIITLIDKRQLRGQLLSLKYGVDDYVIKPPDPLDLRVRIEMAIKRAQFNFYASSLTGLPSGRVIEEAIKERIKKNSPFSFGYVDIDNFKCFNDLYGYQNGDKVIIQTAHLLYNSIKKFGAKNDFIGHIGGDDFVFVTKPERYKYICGNFITMFDRVIPFHYLAKDRARGFVTAKDRSNNVKNISLMTVSVAVVNKNKPSETLNMIEINEKVAEIKRYLKTMPGSKFMAERRNSDIGESISPEIFKKESGKIASYMPLGQILLEKKIIVPEQLDEALKAHWKRGILLGEILKEFGFVKDRDLKDALSEQRTIHVDFANETKIIDSI